MTYQNVNGDIVYDLQSKADIHEFNNLLNIKRDLGDPGDEYEEKEEALDKYFGIQHFLNDTSSGHFLTFSSFDIFYLNKCQGNGDEAILVTSDGLMYYDLMFGGLSYRRSPENNMIDSCLLDFSHLKLSDYDYSEQAPIGVECSIHTTKLEHPIILNGDNTFDSNSAVVDRGQLPSINLNLFKDFEKFPTMSFVCGSRFFNCTATEFAQMISNGSLCLLDFSPDEIRELPESVIQEYIKNGHNISTIQEKFNLRPPEAGFSLIYYYDYDNSFGSEIVVWHRASTVLLSDERKGGKTYLFGQDEGTYFGCELATKPSTIKQAFKDLMPKEIRNKKGVLRQGEWFAIPVEQKDVPSIVESDFLVNGQYNHALILPLDDPKSNHHTVYGRVPLKDDFVLTFPIRVKNGKIFAYEFEMLHSDHVELVGGSSWYTFKRNTAIRSFSVEGVD